MVSLSVVTQFFAASPRPPIAKSRTARFNCLYLVFYNPTIFEYFKHFLHVIRGLFCINFVAFHEKCHGISHLEASVLKIPIKVCRRFIEL